LNEIDLDKDGSISEEEFIKSINAAVSKVIKKNR
jgi:Ca2+-binding EF-hand superfamily protein